MQFRSPSWLSTEEACVVATNRGYNCLVEILPHRITAMMSKILLLRSRINARPSTITRE
jgi:hypothetical protein